MVAEVLAEEWRSVIGFPKYEVSSLGRVRRALAGPRTRIGRVLNPGPRPRGYRWVKLFDELGRGHRRMIHRLVADSFLCRSAEQTDINHKNGIKDDNRADNLEWCTHKQNMEHASRHGLQQHGERSGRAILTESLVRDCRRKYEAGIATPTAMARELGVSAGTIFCAVNRKSWKHVA